MTPLELTAAQIAPAFPGVKLMNIELFWPFASRATADGFAGAALAQDYAKARHAVNGGNHGLERFTNAYKTILGALQ